MAMEKKQQIMLGAVVLCVVGMGGMFLLRSGSDAKQADGTGEVVKRVRDMGKDGRRAGVQRKRRQRATKAAPTVHRRERDSAERKTASRRKRKAKRAGKEKKKLVAPAM